MAIAAALLAVPDASAATIFVNIANLGVEDGTAAHPYNTIGEGIDQAVSGDRVQVAPGVYKETLLMKDGVSVLGSGPPTTIIDATNLQNSVVTFDRTRESPVLSGFTIKFGHGDQISETGGVPVFAGGGILILDSSPTIIGNVITQNTITQGYCLGGGIYVRSNTAAPRIIDNVISGNVALSSTVPGSGDGGAIHIVTKTGSVVVEGNVIESNQALRGGAIFIDNATSSTVQVRRNVFRNNDAPDGGAIFSRVHTGSVTTIANNLIHDNGSDDAGAHGGGVTSYALGTGGFSIANNTLVGNEVSTGTGGALWLDDGPSSAANIVANNVLGGNTALLGGGINYTAFHGEIRKNDFFGNTGGDLYDAGGSTAALIDNLFVDPGFVSPALGNYRLETGSPCIDAAHEPAAPPDDRDGFVRPFDGNGDGTDVSDIGAYEYPSGEVLGTGFLADNILSWPTPAVYDAYNLYRGSLSRLRSTGQYTQDSLVEPLAAHFCDILPAQVPFIDTFAPPSGACVYYLTTAVIGDWEGPLGASSVGLPRPNGNPCP